MKKIPTTVVFDKLIKSHARIIVLQGSARSSKTFSVIQYLIAKAIETPDMRIAICRATLQSLRYTLLVDFKHIMRRQFGLWSSKNFNTTEMLYTFPNGSTIMFSGLHDDSAQKMFGVKFNYVYVNECIHVSYENVEQMLLRLSDGKMLLDFNPACPADFWVYERILKRKDAELHHSTFRDNPFLDESTRNEILKREPTPENIAAGTADEYSWTVYGLGKRANLEGLIFDKYKTIEAFPEHLTAFNMGLDFGYTNDPTALVMASFCDNELYVKELVYETGLTNLGNEKMPYRKSIEGRFQSLNINKNIPIYADCNEPKSIDDLKACGYNVRKVKKWPGSIVDLIHTMRQFPINIVLPSPNLIREIESYQWKKDRSGNYLNEPKTGNDHALDAFRYVVTMTMEIKRGFNKIPYDHCKMKTLVDHYNMFQSNTDDEDERICSKIIF